MAYQTALMSKPYERWPFVTPVDAPVGGRAGVWWGLMVLTAAWPPFPGSRCHGHDA